MDVRIVPQHTGEEEGMRVFPDFGNAQDNATAFHIAMAAIEHGNVAWGRVVLVRLREHLRITHDVKSIRWILPRVEAALQRFSCDEQRVWVDVVADDPRGDGTSVHV
jgi:hypothetical protein